jgi:Cu/Ag efflux pump CusA
MINHIIEFSARNRFIVFLFVAAAVVGGWWSLERIPLDAIPDLSDTQVIVYSRWDRSPDIMEDQVTYPIVSAMLGAPKVKDVRGFSDFGYSYVYIIFDEGTDIYWARSRTLEYLSKILPRLPQGGIPNWGRTPRGSAGFTNMRWWTPPANATWRSCARCRIGIYGIICKPCRAWRRSRRWAASCGSIR